MRRKNVGGELSTCRGKLSVVLYAMLSCYSILCLVPRPEYEATLFYSSYALLLHAIFYSMLFYSMAMLCYSMLCRHKAVTEHRRIMLLNEGVCSNSSSNSNAYNTMFKTLHMYMLGAKHGFSQSTDCAAESLAWIHALRRNP